MIEPYYSDGNGIVIFHADCRDVLPQLGPVDLVLTDPPYGLSFRGNDWDTTIPEWLSLAQRSAPIVAFTTAPTTVWDYPRPDWLACWARPGSTARTAQGGFNSWTPILVYGKHKLPVDTLVLPRITNINEAWIAHPSPKPLRLYRWLIDALCDIDQTVLDPFMGSGTTLRAAKDLGRKAIGIEISEAYCEIAARRLSQNVFNFTG